MRKNDDIPGKPLMPGANIDDLLTPNEGKVDHDLILQTTHIALMAMLDAIMEGGYINVIDPRTGEPRDPLTRFLSALSDWEEYLQNAIDEARKREKRIVGLKITSNDKDDEWAIASEFDLQTVQESINAIGHIRNAIASRLHGIFDEPN